ncbi:MAG: glycosyltransferase, partial [Promicromonosporaceae bacterium]|nr:glycosyltransferase [Promicromonosporaceae bacterium]
MIALSRRLPEPVVQKIGPLVGAVSRVRRPRDLVDVAKLVPVPEVLPARRAAELQGSGLLDAEFYGAQVGQVFHDPQAAARHFVDSRAAGRYSPHPLLNLDVFPAGVLARWRAQGVRAMLGYLFAGPGRRRCWSPLFDPTGLDDARQYLQALGPETELVVSSLLAGPEVAAALTPPLWGQFRSAAIAGARGIREQFDLFPLGPMTPPGRRWDAVAESEWLAGLPSLATVGRPLVSVIMPAWNRADLIGRAIASVRAQDYQDWELLIVDDGSTDETSEVAAALAVTDPRIRLLHQDHAGAAAARNLGLEAAKGTLVAFLDTDNAWRTSFLSAMVRALAVGDRRAAYSAICLHEGGRRPAYRGTQVTLASLQVRNEVDLNVLVAELELVREVGGFDPGLRKLIDYDLVVRLARRAPLLYCPVLGADYHGDERDTSRITVSALDSYRWVVHERALVDWGPAQQRDLAPWRVSVVACLGRSASGLSTISSLLAAINPLDLLAGRVELIVVDNRSSGEQSLAIQAALTAIAGVRYTRLARPFGIAVALNLGASQATGEFSVLLEPGAQWRFGSPTGLTSALADPAVLGAQALVLDGDDNIASAGTRLR